MRSTLTFSVKGWSVIRTEACAHDESIFSLRYGWRALHYAGMPCPASVTVIPDSFPRFVDVEGGGREAVTNRIVVYSPRLQLDATAISLESAILLCGLRRPGSSKHGWQKGATGCIQGIDAPSGFNLHFDSFRMALQGQTPQGWCAAIRSGPSITTVHLTSAP
jgi:hypothetical protein